MNSHTIFALASGGGRAAVAVIRLSGPASGPVLVHLAGSRPAPRVASLRRLRDPADGAALDQALVLWFPGPASVTGEDCAELHLHGGRAVVEAVLSVLARMADCRLAEPGEFTRRSFRNGKLDLAAVEGLADLIESQTDAQRRQALQQLDGALGAWVAVQRAALLRAMAAAESAIDFADEGDVSGDFEAEVRRIVEGLARAVADERGRASTAARVRDGFVVTLAGPPNAGKSTLLNALARRDVAIVSPHAGTTRDAIAVELDLDGWLVICIDTAGLRASNDPVEREGMARTRARAREADLVLWLEDARAPSRPDPVMAARKLWTVGTKADLAPEAAGQSDFLVAATTGQGLPALIAAIRAAVASSDGSGENGVVTRLRHRRALDEAAAALSAILGEDAIGLELAAEQLRRVAAALDALTGRIETEEVLGEIFSRFCIGK